MLLIFSVFCYSALCSEKARAAWQWDHTVFFPASLLPSPAPLLPGRADWSTVIWLERKVGGKTKARQKIKRSLILLQALAQSVLRALCHLVKGKLDQLKKPINPMILKGKGSKRGKGTPANRLPSSLEISRTQLNMTLSNMLQLWSWL